MNSDFENVLPFAHEKLQTNLAVCLVTITAIEDASPRPLGSQMVVASDGSRFGMLTGGCAEQAIAQHAIRMIERDCCDNVRIGSNSPWVDIRLPCGSAIDVNFSSIQPGRAQWVSKAIGMLENRQAVVSHLDLKNGTWEMANKPIENSRHFVRAYHPKLRLAVAGAGPYVTALAKMTGQEFQLEVLSHDEMTLLDLPGTAKKNALNVEAINQLSLDRWSALVVLFHEHDRELPLLKTALNSDCFFIGALGSRKTHAARLNALGEEGFGPEALGRISGPVGLDIMAKSPYEIGVSILAEILLEKNRMMGFAGDRPSTRVDAVGSEFCDV